MLVDLVGVHLLYRTRDRRVELCAAIAEQRAVRDFLRQRMLERVLALGIHRLLQQELALHQRCEGLGEVGVGKLGHRRQDRFCELLLDYRRCLQQVLLALGKAIDARGKHALHRRRNLERLDWRDQPIRPAGAFEASVLDQ